MVQHLRTKIIGLAAILGTLLFTSTAWSDNLTEQPQITPELITQLKSKSNSGDHDATCKLADLYRKGNGINKDLTIAFDLYAEAAREGHPMARYRLGSAYHKGEGTESNQISAWIWLTLASEDDSPVKAEALQLREKVSRSLTEAQQDRAQVLANNFREMFY
ncbi:sel1 repeat family protein [Sansalvadorimonas sp. 2012CJ34-2]|uniref:Sel1 repeat family protein n=1 Tax=Parendozoicomonas callyspongiae TaxID=2942213 RepID=A0ABT0PL02_9GAMM|nr:tetratricopeptide repeat protein [Sansalvadorimonas sp. 2012CJ34-2]MCL6272018.1 sel1 repeat family protein [Sansalvadorimonas sp. 2012CJ34-2]